MRSTASRKKLGYGLTSVEAFEDDFQFENPGRPLMNVRTHDFIAVSLADRACFTSAIPFPEIAAGAEHRPLNLV